MTSQDKVTFDDGAPGRLAAPSAPNPVDDGAPGRLVAPSAPNPVDRGLSLVLTAVGLALWIGITMRSPAALSMLPGGDGCLTAGVVAALLMLLHGVPYRITVLLMVPIAAAQLAVTAAIHMPFLAALGVEMTLLGLFGVVALRLADMTRKPATQKRADAQVASGVPAYQS